MTISEHTTTTPATKEPFTDELIDRYASALIPVVWEGVERCPVSAEDADGKPFDQVKITPARGADPIFIWREVDGTMGVELPGGESRAVASLSEALEPWAELVEALESYRRAA